MFPPVVGKTNDLFPTGFEAPEEKNNSFFPALGASPKKEPP